MNQVKSWEKIQKNKTCSFHSGVLNTAFKFFTKMFKPQYLNTITTQTQSSKNF